MRVTAVIAVLALVLAVFSPLAFGVPAAAAADGPVLTLDTCHPDAPGLSGGGLAPCLVPAGPFIAPTLQLLSIVTTRSESVAPVETSPLPKPPRA